MPGFSINTIETGRSHSDLLMSPEMCTSVTATYPGTSARVYGMVTARCGRLTSVTCARIVSPNPHNPGLPLCYDDCMISLAFWIADRRMR